MPTLLNKRQEAFCRHYAVSGNAAAAARHAGYSETCARQQGYENLAKPFVAIRLDEIRRGFAETAAREAAILLDRLEQVWALAAAAGNIHAMLVTIGRQSKLSGLTGDPATRLRLWGPDGQAGPLERAVTRSGDAAALAAAEAAAPRDPAREDRRLAAPGRVFPADPDPEPEYGPDPGAEPGPAFEPAFESTSAPGRTGDPFADDNDDSDGADGADPWAEPGPRDDPRPERVATDDPADGPAPPVRPRRPGFDRPAAPRVALIPPPGTGDPFTDLAPPPTATPAPAAARAGRG